MNRAVWNNGWEKPNINWLKHFNRGFEFYPMSTAIVNDYADRGIRLIRKTGAITPESPYAIGAVLLLNTKELPDGFEWFNEFE